MACLGSRWYGPPTYVKAHAFFVAHEDKEQNRFWLA